MDAVFEIGKKNGTTRFHEINTRQKFNLICENLCNLWLQI